MKGVDFSLFPSLLYFSEKSLQAICSDSLPQFISYLHLTALRAFYVRAKVLNHNLALF